ncbi:hypothetical protein RBI80_16885 [Klebsiella variicola]|nr:hypothetical protein RBI80_16885 [Klebsiella variicola]
MNSSDTEEITDEIIGEAVLALLKTNRPITTPTLLVRLRLMQATESDRQRRKIIAAVIEEICAKLALQRKLAPLQVKKINGRWESRGTLAQSSMAPEAKKSTDCPNHGE